VKSDSFQAFLCIRYPGGNDKAKEDVFVLDTIDLTYKKELNPIYFLGTQEKHHVPRPTFIEFRGTGRHLVHGREDMIMADVLSASSFLQQPPNVPLDMRWILDIDLDEEE